ncbi:Hypothetical protein PHPALM_38108 [Phytophthora palmivora]|uniref:Alcohol dehydrogenase n=1 Tax=Phytophthora palmivora TaxID=4796 RepID=A0A2P4WVR8_9STRA|nr:Hypothetical protein PHPALM_38108 [Phytophthora palmivora]
MITFWHYKGAYIQANIQGMNEDVPDITGPVLGKSYIIRGIAIGSQLLLRDLVQFVSDHNIQPFVQKTFGFNREQVLEAFDYLQTGSHIGKVGIEIKL